MKNKGTKERGREKKWTGTLQSVNVTYISASLRGTAQWFNRCVCLCSVGTVCIFPASPLCLLPRCPLSLSLMRLDAWLPQHLPWVATGLIPPGFLSHFVFRLSLCYASGLLTAAGTVREGDEEGGEVTGGADTPGFPPLAQQNELYQTPLDT